MDNSSLLLQRRLLWRASSIWPEAEPRPRGGEACFRESEHFSSPSLSLLFFKGAKANVSSNHRRADLFKNFSLFSSDKDLFSLFFLPTRWPAKVCICRNSIGERHKWSVSSWTRRVIGARLFFPSLFPPSSFFDVKIPSLHLRIKTGSPRQTRSGRTRSEAGGGAGGSQQQQPNNLEQQQQQAAAAAPAPSQARGASRRTTSNAAASTGAAPSRAPSARSGRTRSAAGAAAVSDGAGGVVAGGASPAATPADAATGRRSRSVRNAASAGGAAGGTNGTPFPNPASRSRGAIGTVSAVRRRGSISTGVSC